MPQLSSKTLMNFQQAETLESQQPVQHAPSQHLPGLPLSVQDVVPPVLPVQSVPVGVSFTQVRVLSHFHL